MRIPAGVIAVLVLCLIASAAFTYLRRKDYAGGKGFVRVWTVFEDFVSQTLMLVMIVAATIQVIVRFLLSSYVTVTWTEELALLALVWISFWSAATVSRHRDHIALTILYDIMPMWMRRAVLIFGDLVIIGITVPLAWSGFTNARWLDILKTVSLGVPISTFAYVIPLTMTLFAIHTVFQLIDHIISPTIEEGGNAELEAYS